jgi:hypothetical protein
VLTTHCETVSKNRVTRRRTTSGSAPGHKPRRVHDVDEQHGCELSLHV